MSDTQAIAQMAHLMRRAGFGASRDELERLRRAGLRGNRRAARRSARAHSPRRPLPTLPLHALARNRRPRHSARRRQLALPPGQHPATAGREDGPLLARRVCRRQLQGRQRQSPDRPDRHVPRARHRQLPRPADHARPEPGDDLLARQPREPQALAQRELGPRAARTVLDGRRQLHREGRLRVRPRLHRLDARPQNPARAQPPLLLPVRVPTRRARLRREGVPRPQRQLRRP